MPNEQEKFLKDLQTDAPTDPFARLDQTDETTETDEPAETQSDDEQEEETKLKPRNRRERRLEAKLEAERKYSIQMAERLEAITSAQNARTSEPSDYLKAVERIYGTDSPESREATEILKAAIMGAKDDAKREALEAYEAQREAERRKVQEAEGELDTMVEDIEEEFDVDLTSAKGKKARTDFYTLLEKMSPKDKDGNILHYADHFAVWEQYQEKLQRKADPTAKTLASRSMRSSSGTSDSKLQVDTAERYLKENGII